MVRLTPQTHFSLLHMSHAFTLTESTEECKNSGQTLVRRKLIHKCHYVYVGYCDSRKFQLWEVSI